MYMQTKNLFIRIFAICAIIYIFIPIVISLVAISNNNVDTEVMIDKIVSEPIITHSLSVAEYQIMIEPEIEQEPVELVERVIVDSPPEFSEEDISLIARVTMSEASTQSFDVQVAVAQTVINRLYSGDFGGTISEVVYSRNQFSTADNGNPTDGVISAVKEAITNHPYPDNMFFFRQYYYHEWAVDYQKLGDLYFSTDT